VFKKLDKLIIKAFIGPFIATFFITVLVLIMQFFWLWIDDFVGKGLGIDVVFRFIWYQSAVLVPLALPLAILLSSLMTFGNLGETFELVAIKSSGISLLRFMRPLFIISVLISGIAFLFSNYIIPVANLKSRTLLADIVQAQPAFDLKEGVFYDKISGFAIKIGKKEKNDTTIRDVIIYEQGNPVQDNFIIAKSGVMRVTADKRFLEFNLKDGWRYQERGGQYSGLKTDYIRLGFKEYKKQFDLSSFQITWTNDSVNKNNERVYSMRQLDIAIDSLEKENAKVRSQITENTYGGLAFTRFFDTIGNKQLPPDTIKNLKKGKSLWDLIPTTAAPSVQERVVGQLNSLRSGVEGSLITMKERERNLRKHKIEWHRKIVLSLACIVLFMIGAPMGSIIRKGGLGTPLIIAIGFFMLFYFSTTTGEKFAKEDTMTPFAGMWMATFILVPIGLFLTYKAMRDSTLFNKDKYVKFILSVTRFFRFYRVSR
jgi:lipopolysaccharide export system permease protein